MLPAVRRTGGGGPRRWSDGRAYGSNSVPGILPDLHDHLVAEIGYAEVARNAGVDVADEVRVVVEFLQVLACRNVRAIDVQPSEALNHQRERKGKEPFDTVRILTVGDVAIGGARGAGSRSNEDGYKVREHLRTGHIRRLSGYNTWVNDCIVAPGSPLGRAAKSYAVK